MRISILYDKDQKGYFIRVKDISDGTLFTMDYDGILMNNYPLIVGIDLI